MRAPKFGLFAPHAPRQLLPAEPPAPLRPTLPAQPCGAGSDGNKNKNSSPTAGQRHRPGENKALRHPSKASRGSSQRWLREVWVPGLSRSPYLRAVPPAAAPSRAGAAASSPLRGCRGSDSGWERAGEPPLGSVSGSGRVRLCVCVCMCVCV